MQQGEVIDFANPPMLAEGVGGYCVETDKGLYIPAIRAINEGSGEVGRYLDSLPWDRRVVIPNIINPKLAGMLERRGFMETTEHVEELGESIDIMVRELQGHVESRTSVSVILQHHLVRASVAQANIHLAGPPGAWWVSRVLVHRNCRGHGVGKALVARMLELCVEQGATEVHVAPGGYDNDTERQRGFYAACGFEATSEEGLMIWRPT